MSEVESLERISEYVTECPYCKKELVIPVYRVKPETLKQFRERTRKRLKKLEVEDPRKRESHV
ncbi:hypothetical protein DRO19_02765 [Candidatus Bathyarchaeota archaeon]|nr:MAG: hypothetical protein DRO19_02765 [Candidatus Bathyarchaeota archaeon]